MKQFKLFSYALLCSFFLAVNAHAAPAQCQVEPAAFKGWNAFKLSNGLVTLYVAPDIGGRVIQFQLADHPFFFVNEDLAGKVFPPEENGGEKGGWKNYGGDKLWPAPQGWERDDQWPGPPDPVLDGGKYAGEIARQTADQAAVSVTSPPDPRTGIQLSRTISLFPGSTQVRVDCAMKNISRRPVRWAIWEVTQHDAADPKNSGAFNNDFWAFCPLNSRSFHPKGFYPMFGQVNHPSFRADNSSGLLSVKYDYRVGKVGLDSDAGWLAVDNGQSDHCFVQTFAFFPQQTYPDYASVEFWLNGAGEFMLNGLAITNAPDPKVTPYLMETEILSPLAKLDPDQEYRFRIDWFATRCPKPVVDVTPVGAVSQRLRVSLEGGLARLEGVFGVFHQGRAEAVFKAADGKVLGRDALGPVEPNQVFRLSKEVRLPPGAFRVSVNLIDAQGHNRGALGNVMVPAH